MCDWADVEAHLGARAKLVSRGEDFVRIALMDGLEVKVQVADVRGDAHLFVMVGLGKADDFVRRNGLSLNDRLVSGSLVLEGTELVLRRVERLADLQLARLDRAIEFMRDEAAGFTEWRQRVSRPAHAETFSMWAS